MNQNPKPSSGNGKSLTGTEGVDHLRGHAAGDVLRGFGGDDKLWGCGGADQIFAGAGNDKVWGGKGADTIDGGDGNDRLAGQAGNDFIRGGFGVDVLSGGKGDDIYAFGIIVNFSPGTSAAFSAGLSDTGVGDKADVITNFDGAGEAGGDIIDLSVINYFGRRIASNPEFSFVGNEEFNGNFAQLRFEVRGGYTVIQMDGVRTPADPIPLFVGDKVPDAEIIVLGEHQFTASDFIL
ncbi:calcium-binding protein [Belnapia sp. F-4-1]|uniref:calcium-binding protein n=1 Tax=Belnapia sp. F-4-1 TaxID=1545443 RepID=UPI001364B16F|nr:hypothetical protein [Belnapia sp. F-4-1]